MPQYGWKIETLEHLQIKHPGIPGLKHTHRVLQPRGQVGKPHVIIAKLHYYQDFMDILHCVREFGPLYFNDTNIYFSWTVHQASCMPDLLSTRWDDNFAFMMPLNTVSFTQFDSWLYLTELRDNFKILKKPWRMWKPKSCQTLTKKVRLFTLTQHLADTLCTTEQCSSRSGVSKLFWTPPKRATGHQHCTLG